MIPIKGNHVDDTLRKLRKTHEPESVQFWNKEPIIADKSYVIRKSTVCMDDGNPVNNYFIDEVEVK